MKTIFDELKTNEKINLYNYLLKNKLYNEIIDFYRYLFPKSTSVLLSFLKIKYCDDIRIFCDNSENISLIYGYNNKSCSHTYTLRFESILNKKENLITQLKNINSEIEYINTKKLKNLHNERTRIKDELNYL